MRLVANPPAAYGQAGCLGGADRLGGGLLGPRGQPVNPSSYRLLDDGLGDLLNKPVMVEVREDRRRASELLDIEGRDRHAGGGESPSRDGAAVASKQLRDDVRQLWLRALQLEMKPAPPVSFENGLQRGNARTREPGTEPRAGVQLLALREREIGGLPDGVRGSLQSRVVDDHRHTSGWLWLRGSYELDVQFEIADAGRDGGVEGFQRVFRRDRGVAAVSDNGESVSNSSVALWYSH